MTPLFVIKVKVKPCLGRSGSSHSRYDASEVVEDDLLVSVHYASTLSIVVTPRGNDFDGNMVVRILCHFAEEG